VPDNPCLPKHNALMDTFHDSQTNDRVNPESEALSEESSTDSDMGHSTCNPLSDCDSFHPVGCVSEFAPSKGDDDDQTSTVQTNTLPEVCNTSGDSNEVNHFPGHFLHALDA